MQVPCPCCEGRGRILSAETVATRIQDELRAARPHNNHEAYLIWADPAVVLTLIGPHGEYLEQLEEAAGAKLYVRSTENIHPERYEITGGSDGQFRKQHLPHEVGQVLTIHPDEVISVPAMGLVAAVNGYPIDIPEASPKVEQDLKVRLTKVDRSYASATPVA